MTRHSGKKSIRRLAILAFGAVTVSACTDAAGYDLDMLLGKTRVLSMMRGTIAYQPHELPRLPAEGSIPIDGPMGDNPPAFTQTQLDSVGAVLTNPLPASPEVLARGKVVYERQCSVCHGVEGDGAGTVVGPGRFPPSTALRERATAVRSDGYMYGVIRVGRGLMPAYGSRVAHNDRWAVVHYIRELQGGVAAAPTPAAATQPLDSAAGTQLETAQPQAGTEQAATTNAAEGQ